MDLERAVETQRDALLRLLARLLFLVEVIACTPVSGRIPRWVSSMVSGVLHRAEMATGYLLIACARVLVAKGMSGGLQKIPAPKDAAPVLVWDCIRETAHFSLDDAVSASGLLMRIRALRAVLENLPREALRLLQRHADARFARRKMVFGDRQVCDFERSIMPAMARLCAARLERPPDKALSAPAL